MKLAPRTFRIEWDVHAWSGVIGSLLLFVVFFCGVFALFRTELEIWQDPALQVAPSADRAGAGQAFDTINAQLERSGLPRGARFGISLADDTRFASVWTYEPASDKEDSLFVDTHTGAVARERSRLAYELYVMHFFYRLPYGMEFTGFLSVLLLVALVSGLLIHLKDLWRQWWQFRTRLRLRYSASDAHKVLSVFGLPFTLIFGWSGALLCVGGLVDQALAATNFAGNGQRIEVLRGYDEPEREASGRQAAMLPFSELTAKAQAALATQVAPDYVRVSQYRDANAWCSFWWTGPGLIGEQAIALDAVSGAVLHRASDVETPAHVLSHVLYDIHFARFGGLLLKLLFALLSLAVCAVIVTGNLIFIERRDPERAQRGNRWLERLSVSFCAGLALGAGSYFVANRALPWDLNQRAEVEFGVFLGVWALATLLGLFPRISVRDAGAALCGGAALCFGGVVAVDIATVDANLFTALARGLPAVFVCEVLLLALAAGCAALAYGLRRTALTAAG